MSGSRPFSRPIACGAAILALLLACDASAWAGPRKAAKRPPQPLDPIEVINRAKAQAVEIPEQAEALARLAWPDDADVDPAVRAAARKDLVDFGKHGLNAIRMSLQRTDPLYSADIATALVEARRNAHSGNPPDFLPGLEEAIWYGSVDARRVAILEMSRFYFPPAILTTIDAIYENPELAEVGIQALGRMADQRSRFFLSDVLNWGSPPYRELAAQALAQLDDKAGANVLRRAAVHEDAAVRQVAVDAFLPLAEIDDLSLLYEYLGGHPDDDSGVLERVRARALELEAEFERKQRTEGASVEAEPGADR